MNNPRLLIVDDEADMRWVIRGVFEDEGFEIAEVTSHRKSLEDVFLQVTEGLVQ